MIRIITGLIAGAGWVLLLYSGSFFLLWLVVCILSGIALLEYTGMALTGKEKNLRFIVVGLGLMPLLATFFGRPDTMAAGLALALLLMFILILFRYQTFSNPLESMTRIAFGVVYLGFSLAHLPLIMAETQGAAWLLVLALITALSDTGAYYFGKLFGKTKLCPAISPGKTVAGFIGGLGGGLVAAVASTAFLFPKLHVMLVVAMAITIVCVGVVGDLTESVIKRATGIKDSGTILPGHGGVLDRIDSILMTAPLFFYLIHFGILTAG